MTKVTNPVTRETACTVQGREVILTIHPAYLEMRLKRTRTRYVVPVSTVFQVGARIAAEKLRIELLMKRALRRGQKSITVAGGYRRVRVIHVDKQETGS